VTQRLTDKHADTYRSLITSELHHITHTQINTLDQRSNLQSPAL